MQDEKYVRYGYTNGFFQGKQLFVCLENAGMFTSFDKLFPTASLETRLASHPKLSTVLGSRLPVQKCLFCSVDSLESEAGLSQPVSHTLPMGREFPAASPHRSTNISVGSTIEIGNPKSPHYGTVRWIGLLPGHEEVVAGIEMVSTCNVGINSDVLLYMLLCNRRKSLNTVEMATWMVCSISSVPMVELTSAHSCKLD